MNDNVANILDMDSLTPGSVWTRRNGKESRYLFTTNTTLPQSMASEHPQMAVYADENDNIFSVPVGDFVGKRTFFNVDPDLERRLGNLLAFSVSQDDVDTFDLLGEDDLTINTESDEIQENISSDGMQTTSVPVTNNAFPIEFFSGGSGLPEILSSQRLSEMAECYQQEPLVSEGKMLHRLFFRVGRGVTHDTLYACFSPKHVELNAVYTFKVHTPDGLLDVDWDAMLGIYPYIFQNVSMLQVMFTTGTELNYVQLAEEPEIVTSSKVEDGNVVIAAPDEVSNGSDDVAVEAEFAVLFSE